MLWPDDKCVRYAAIRERMTPEEGKRMRCIRGAKAAHAKMRARGIVPGEAGRRVIETNRAARKRDQEEGSGWRIGHTSLNGI